MSCLVNAAAFSLSDKIGLLFKTRPFALKREAWAIGDGPFQGSPFLKESFGMQAPLCCPFLALCVLLDTPLLGLYKEIKTTSGGRTG